MDYADLTARIDRRCKLLSVVEVPGIEPERLQALREDATGISTLELTCLSRALHISIASLMGI